MPDELINSLMPKSRGMPKSLGMPEPFQIPISLRGCVNPWMIPNFLGDAIFPDEIHLAFQAGVETT